MDTATFPRPPRRKRRGRGWAILFFLLAAIGLLAAAAVWYVRVFGPVDTRIVPNYGADKPVFYEGRPLAGTAIGSGETLKLPLPLIQAELDPNVHYEESSSSILITTEQRVIRLVTEQLTAWVNDEPFELRFPAEVMDGIVYVPIDPLADVYGIQALEAPETGYVVLRKPGDVLVHAVAPEADEGEGTAEIVFIRSEPSVRAPIVGELAPGEQAAVWNEASGWYFVQLDDGTVGYTDKRSLVMSGTTTYQPEAAEGAPYVPKRPMGQRVVLTWEQVYTNNPDTSKLGAMPGLNVVSPTWFHVLDAEGAIENRADKAYVQWAHARGYQVWALFSNSFEPDVTSEALSTYERRMTMARQLISWARLYELDGINIDFENMHLKDGPKLTQFLRELTPLLHEADMTVSVDVTFAGGSEMWSLFYDRKALGEIVDYMMVMAYDEHWAASPVAGSVASLPWVKRGVKRIIDEHDVPAGKIILGIPYYTRIWTEETVDGKKKVSSKAVGMDTVEALLKEKELLPTFDEAAGQHYVQYEEGGAVKKIWIEDETSLKARAAIVEELGLAGVASWSRSFASDRIWKTIDDALHKRK